MNIFVGMKNLWIFLGGHHKTGLFLGSFFGLFLKEKAGGVAKIQIFF